MYGHKSEGPILVLDAETGEVLDRYPNTHRIYDSPFQPIQLLDRPASTNKGSGIEGPVELRRVGGKRFATIARETFAILAAAFGPDRLCVTESGGPVHCLDTENGTELWRDTPRPNRHRVALAYSSKAKAFFGFEWPYVHGGSRELRQFNIDDGTPTRVTKIVKRAAHEVFRSRSDALLTSEGELIDVANGKAEQAFRFPSRHKVGGSW